MIKAVVFDMDGVIFDSEKLYRKHWMITGAEYGIPEETMRELCNLIAGSTKERNEKLMKSRFGEDFDYTATSDTHQTDAITLYFKDEADANAQYTTEVPTAVGSYRVKAVFAEGINYKELTVEDTFTISRMQASADMYTVEAPTRDDGWYEGIMNVKGANGNTISTAESGTFQETLSISEEMASFTFYIKTSTGAITDAVTLTDIKIDKTAPVISVIDGTTSTALTSGSTYDGTLHLTVSDAGVGIARITLKENPDALIQAEDGSYYILQTEADRTYTIVGTDDLGNSVTYDTVTVKAYQQDVEVTISENEGVYGSEIAITISIKNTSNAPITNVTYALSEAETTNAFDALNGTMDKIAAGATETITVLILDGTHPGEYVSSLELSYVSAGEVEEANVEKHFTTEVLAIVLSPDASKEMYTLSTPTVCGRFDNFWCRRIYAFFCRRR